MEKKSLQNSFIATANTLFILPAVHIHFGNLTISCSLIPGHYKHDDGIVSFEILKLLLAYVSDCVDKTPDYDMLEKWMRQITTTFFGSAQRYNCFGKVLGEPCSIFLGCRSHSCTRWTKWIIYSLQ